MAFARARSPRHQTSSRPTDGLLSRALAVSTAARENLRHPFFIASSELTTPVPIPTIYTRNFVALAGKGLVFVALRAEYADAPEHVLEVESRSQKELHGFANERVK